MDSNLNGHVLFRGWICRNLFITFRNILHNELSKKTWILLQYFSMISLGIFSYFCLLVVNWRVKRKGSSVHINKKYFYFANDLMCSIVECGERKKRYTENLQTNKLLILIIHISTSRILVAMTLLLRLRHMSIMQWIHQMRITSNGFLAWFLCFWPWHMIQQQPK